MKFGVKALSNGKARVGVVQLPNCVVPIETPSLLLATRKGLPHFLSPDLLSALPSPDSHLLQFSPLYLCLSYSVGGLSTPTMSSVGGLHQMLGLQEYGFGANLRDSIVCIPEPNSTNKFGASFQTPNGRLLIQPAEYMKMISSLDPNWLVSIPDEVPAWVTEKRNKISVDRTIRWLDECINLKKTDGSIFGAIVGGCSMEERKRCAHEIVKRDVSGFWLGGFGFGETVDARSALLNAVTDILPEDKPRQVCGLGLPEEVLQGVASGIDLFESSYICQLTVGGYALTFPVDNTEMQMPNYQLSNVGSDLTKINLRATVYRKDSSPVVEKCCCYTCQNHSRAYINHLLNVHEMLAQILLEIHNTHHYLKFFGNIRDAIRCGKFEQFRCKFMETRRNHLATDAEISQNSNSICLAL
ncbi:uncharacterized protein [Spinacia oleracea]|uniref:Queuine tRNA-ribosyltransferase accessory subunit 2 n=1 Tax=Spinacia oleracea TaxID=3562 RepID=A0A9R0JTF0_SPIOL|nr:uncharacterized protein LOC110786238 isoform X1 [Spinacia oleracea]